MWLPRITARCPIAVQEDVFSTLESTEVCSFVAIALEIQYWLHCHLCLCCNIRNSSLLGHTAQDFGEEIGSSVIKYYFALGKINKWASSAAYFVTVLRTVLHFSDKQTVTYFQPRFWVVLCFAVGFVWFLFFFLPFQGCNSFSSEDFRLALSSCILHTLKLAWKGRDCCHKLGH